MRWGFFSFLVCCMVLGGDEAQRLRRLAETLRNLRKKMEARRNRLLQEVDSLTQQVAAKRDLVASLKEELAKTSATLNETKQRIDTLKERLKQVEEEAKKIHSLLESSRKRLNAAILSSIPFKRARRTVEPKEGLGQLFDAVVEGHLNDVALACSVEAYREILRVNGRRLRGYMVRLGLVAMVFAADNGEAAVWTRQGWKIWHNIQFWRAIRKVAEQALKRTVPRITPVPIPAEVLK